MGGHHHHIDPEAGDARVFWAVVINLLLTIAQIIGGVISGSLALIADAIHNLSDAIALAIAIFARKIARKPADGKMTFGYGRAEIVAALVNYTTLIVIAIYLIYEGIMRFFTPEGVDGWIVVIVAGIALVIDFVTAGLTYAMSKDSANMRAAFLHNVADALGSIAVIIAGTLIILFDWKIVDPIVTLMIAGYILWLSFAEIGPVIRMLMLATPEDIDVDKVLAAMNDINGVSGVHHLHVWQMQEHEAALDAHILIREGDWGMADAIKANVRRAVRDAFGIDHTTLELECSNHPCEESKIIGHPCREPHEHTHEHGHSH